MGGCEYMGSRIGHAIFTGTYRWRPDTGQLGRLAGGRPVTTPAPDTKAPSLREGQEQLTPNGYGPLVCQFGEHGLAVLYRIADLPAIAGLAGIRSGPSSDGASSWSSELVKDVPGYHGSGTSVNHARKPLVKGTLAAGATDKRWQLT